MLESMAAGVPVVATAVVETLNSVAWACVAGFPNDEAALAEGLERVLADEELRREMSHRARQFALENFSVERIREQYCEL